MLASKASRLCGSRSSAAKFVAHYQPIVHLASERIDKFEALTRWRRPDGGLVAPAQFIDIAEETGLICSIGRFMMLQATSDCAIWQRSMPGVGVTVNVSARQLAEQDVVALAREALGASHLAPTLLTVELTESALLHEPHAGRRETARATRDGRQVALDDFGTGYSSLTYLRTLPIDVLKIDKSFVAALSEANDDSSIVAAIIELAHACLSTSSRRASRSGRSRSDCGVSAASSGRDSCGPRRLRSTNAFVRPRPHPDTSTFSADRRNAKKGLDTCTARPSMTKPNATRSAPTSDRSLDRRVRARDVFTAHVVREVEDCSARARPGSP